LLPRSPATITDFAKREQQPSCTRTSHRLLTSFSAAAIQRCKTLPAEGAEAGLISGHLCVTLSSRDLRLLLHISRRLLPKDSVSDGCMQTSELLPKNGGRGEKIKKGNLRGYFYL